MTDINNFKSIIDYLEFRDETRDINDPVIDYHGNIISRGEAKAITNYYNDYMHSIGVRPGDIVGICNITSAEYQFLYESVLKLGGVNSTVSESFFKSDFKGQILDKNIDTLILSVEYITPELKEAFRILKERPDINTIKRIIFTSAGTYLSKEDEIEYLKNLNYEDKINFLDLPKSINITYPNKIKDDFERGIKLPKYENGKNLLDNDATYSNSGGTSTGIPKCAVHTHRDVISFMQVHEPDVFPDADMRVNDRALMLIPFSHITAQFYAYLIHRASGATLVFNHQAFNPNEIDRILVEEEINTVLSPFGLYIPLLQSKRITKNSLKHLRHALCGGEPTPYGPTKLINNKLVEAGANPLEIGCGSTEFGSGIMGSYGIPNRVNESGITFPGVNSKVINPNTGKEVNPGDRGILYCNAPWQMDRYLNDEKATRDFFHLQDKDGMIYGTNNDIVRQVGEYKNKPMLLMEGRASDFVLKNQETNKYYPGVTITNGKTNKVNFKEGNFKFVMRDNLLNIYGILEAEIVLIPDNDNSKEGSIVVNLTTFPNVSLPDILRKVKESFENTDFTPSGIIFRTKFARSLSTDKRETLSLIDERVGYYTVGDDNKVYSVELPQNGDIIYTLIDDESKLVKVEPPAPKKILVKND